MIESVNMAESMEKYQLKLLFLRDISFSILKISCSKILRMIENHANFLTVLVMHKLIRKAYETVDEAHGRYTLSVDEDVTAKDAVVKFKANLDVLMRETEAKMKSFTEREAPFWSSYAEKTSHANRRSRRNSDFRNVTLVIVPSADGSTLLMNGFPGRPFNGDPRRWPEFISCFERLVHKTLKTKVQRRIALQKLLTPAVRSIIAEYLVSPSTYYQALEALKERYGNPNFILRVHTQAILNLKKAKGCDPAVLEKSFTSLTEVLNFFQISGFENEIKSLSRLDDILARRPSGAWDKHSYLTTSSLNLKAFANWLEVELNKSVRNLDVGESKTENLRT